MQKALNKTGRPIYYQISNDGAENVWEWGAPLANQWSVHRGSQDTWQSLVDTVDLLQGKEKFASRGAWNSPGFLQLGNGGLKYKEYQAQFALWCILKAPLIIGNDLSKMNKNMEDILSNEEIIEIN